MKKIIILTGILAGSFFYTAKAEGNGFGLFQEQEQSPEQTAANVEYQTMDTDPGSPGDQPSPINQYIPVLMLAGLGLAFFAAKKNRKLSE